jgi:phosphoserine phosphatase
MKRPVVFDFDKTLTEKDTLVGFYREVSKSEFMFKLKLPLLWMAAIIYKTGFISNSTLKKIGIWLFLKGKNRIDIQKSALKYSSKIKLNKIQKNDFLKYPSENVIIISASFEDYLRPLFPDHEVVGSTLAYEKDIVIGLSSNMYGNNKRDWLLNQDIDRVAEFFTDSYADLPLMKLSDTVYLIDKGIKTELKMHREGRGN